MPPKTGLEKVTGMARFNDARLLLTGVELNLYTLLAPAPLSAQEITDKLGADLRGLTVLLDALAAVGLLTKTGDRYQVEPSVAPYLSEGEPESILPGLQHAAHLWYSWTNLTEIVRSGRLPARPVTSFTEDRVKAFIGAMHLGASRAAAGVVTAIAPGSARALLDVGGGSGSYTLAFLEACPDLKATIFDLPSVIDMAQDRVGRAGLTHRVTFAAGDYYHDEFPGGHDLALLSAIIHSNSFQENLDLYRKVFRSLIPGGRIVIRDHVMAPDRTQPVSGALFAVNMLVNTPGGGTYTYAEIEQGLSAAGFERIKQMQSGGMFSLVEAFKPAG